MKRMCGWLLGGLTACSIGDTDTRSGETDSSELFGRRIGTAAVSVLFPLCNTADGLNKMVRPSDPGLTGAIFPDAVYQSVLAESASDYWWNSAKGQIDYTSLRLVAARVTDCSNDAQPQSEESLECTPQLRLTFQQVDFIPDAGQCVARKNTQLVHVSYRIEPLKFKKFVSDWVARSTRIKGPYRIPLGIHPLLKEEPVGGSLQLQYQRLIAEVAGAKSISAVTMYDEVTSAERAIVQFEQPRTFNPTAAEMELAEIPGTVRNVEWMDGDIDRAQRTLQRLEIYQSQQRNEVKIGGRGEFSEALVPLFGRWVNGQVEFEPASTIESAAAFANRLENPTLGLHQGTVDCAACHLATETKYRAQQLGQTLSQQNTYLQSKRNLERVAAGKAQGIERFVRAFGYVGAEPAIIQRTINESADVAERIEQLLAR